MGNTVEARAWRIYVGYLDMNVQNLGVDLMTVNGSKIYGPKGVGFLYVKNKVELSPIIYGGGQEAGLRSGTENVPAIAMLSARRITDTLFSGLPPESVTLPVILL